MNTCHDVCDNLKNARNGAHGRQERSDKLSSWYTVLKNSRDEKNLQLDL
jgi:hypothetical protein